MKTPQFFDRSELTRTLWAFRREFFVCGIFSAVVNILMLTPTLYMLQVYSLALVSRNEVTLLAITLVMVFLFLVMAFAEWSRSRLLVRAGLRFDAGLNSRVFNACFDAHLNNFGRSPVQAFTDLINVRQFLTGNGLFAFFDAPWLPVYIAVMFLLHPMLGWLSIVFALILLALGFLTHYLSRDVVGTVNDVGVQENTYLRSKIRNVEVIEALGMVDNLCRLWRQRHLRTLKAGAQAHDVAVRLQSLTKFVRYSMQSLMLGAGAILVIRGDLFVGSMVAANVLMSRALQPLDLAIGSWKSFISARAAFLRLEKLLAEHPDALEGEAHEVPDGAIRVEGLTATAPGRAAPILDDLSASFPGGKLTVVIGPSGSGKSTLGRALCGVWPQVQGRVLIDSVPIEAWGREALGRHLGYLPQDVELFEGSIAENIARFGTVDPEQVITAARRTGVHDMILRFAKGYDTLVGEAGSMLSGGQRQRIGLARAIYGEPNIVVLDEPNANLDDVGEAALVRTVTELKEHGCTVFLITHRPNIIRAADNLLMLENGVIRHCGARDDVLAALRAPGNNPPPSSSLQPA